jgi:hypothetical protein
MQAYNIAWHNAGMDGLRIHAHLSGEAEASTSSIVLGMGIQAASKRHEYLPLTYIPHPFHPYPALSSSIRNTHLPTPTHLPSSTHEHRHHQHLKLTQRMGVLTSVAHGSGTSPRTLLPVATLYTLTPQCGGG